MNNKTPLNFGEASYYDGGPEGFDVYSWSPTPQAEVDAGRPQAPSTQVHLHVVLGALGRAIYRFKGPGTLDSLIGALIKHRVDVWGLPKNMKAWMR